MDWALRRVLEDVMKIAIRKLVVGSVISAIALSSVTESMALPLAVTGNAVKGASPDAMAVLAHWHGHGGWGHHHGCCGWGWGGGWGWGVGAFALGALAASTYYYGRHRRHYYYRYYRPYYGPVYEPYYYY